VSENQLIMNDTTAPDGSAILRPEDTHAGILPQTQGQKISQLHYGNQMEQHFKGLKKLSARNMSFAKPGTVTVKMAVDGEIKEVLLDIQSVSDDVWQPINTAHQEIVNQSVKVMHPTLGTWVHDENHPTYLEHQKRMLDSWNHTQYLRVVYGLLMEIEDLDGNVVWHPFDKTKQFPEQAVNVIRTVMQITPSERDRILDAIENISAVAEKERREDIEKK
jgi:hypothetical protein